MFKINDLKKNNISKCLTSDYYKLFATCISQCHKIRDTDSTQMLLDSNACISAQRFTSRWRRLSVLVTKVDLPVDVTFDPPPFYSRDHVGALPIGEDVSEMQLAKDIRKSDVLMQCGKPLNEILHVFLVFDQPILCNATSFAKPMIEIKTRLPDCKGQLDGFARNPSSRNRVLVPALRLGWFHLICARAY